MKYCKDASKLLGIRVICGQDCPLINGCPRLTMEDAADRAIEKALREMIEIIKRRNETNKG